MTVVTPPAPTTNKLWTKDQVVGAIERSFLAALGAFVGALTITNTSPLGLEHSAIAAGIAAGIAFVTKLGSYLGS